MSFDRPKVVFEDSTKQAVVDDWEAFVRDNLAPLPVVCPTCNGVVQVESHRHLFARKGYADADVQGVDPAVIDRIVRGTVEHLGVGKVWERAMRDSPALNYVLRGDNRVLAEGFAAMKWDDGKLDFVARAVGRDLLPRTDTITLYTYCPNCEDYIEAELPEYMRNDARHELMRRVAAFHRLEHTWQKPEAILPKEAPPLPPSAPDWIGGPEPRQQHSLQMPSAATQLMYVISILTLITLASIIMAVLS